MVSNALSLSGQACAGAPLSVAGRQGGAEGRSEGWPGARRRGLGACVRGTPLADVSSALGIVPRPRRGGSANPRSSLAQDQVERPAPPDVRPRRAQVRQELGVGAAGLFEGVGEDGQAVVGPLLVDALR